MRTVYIAAPLFSDQDRAQILQIEGAFSAAGMSCFVPHREVGDLSVLRHEKGESEARTFIFNFDFLGVQECAVLCALLDGSDTDSGTAAEMGFAYALGKPIFGLCTDVVRRGKTLNNVIWGLCGGGDRVHTSIESLVTAVRRALELEALEREGSTTTSLSKSGER